MIYFFVSWIVFWLYILFRNWYVLEYRLRAIDRSNCEYNRLPSYERMLFQLFTFDWSYCTKDDAE